MSDYLQRLYDRAAGGLPLAAPAFRPGSPLARFDQRLSIAELAQDFTFGARPDTPVTEPEELVVPPLFGSPVDGPSEVVETPRAENRRDVAKPGKSRRAGRERAPAISSSPSEPQAQPRRSKRKSVTEPTAASSSRPAATPVQSTAIAGEPPAQAGNRTVNLDQPVQPAPAIAERPAAQAPPAGVLRLEPTPITEHPAADSRRPIAPPPTEAIAPTATQPRPDEPADPRPFPAPSMPPSPSAEPVLRDMPPTVLPRPAAFDWSEVDQRIERALRGLNESRPQRPGRQPVRIANESPQEADSRLAKEFMTAAEASVIGSIEHSPRHRMLFGIRWR